MAKVKYLILNLKNRLVYDEIKPYTKKLETIDIPYRLVVAPGDCYLSSFQSKKYDLCAQDISTYDFMCTGEVGGDVLKALNCKYVIVGHNERRKLYDDEYTIEKKIKNALKNNLRVLYYIGEDSKQNQFFVKELLKIQIRNVFDYIDPNERDNIYIVYEPAWLIGKEEALNSDDVNAIVEFIKDHVNKKYLFVPKVIYGGGVGEDDLKRLMEDNELDGVVVSSISEELDTIQENLK